MVISNASFFDSGLTRGSLFYILGYLHLLYLTLDHFMVRLSQKKLKGVI